MSIERHSIALIEQNACARCQPASQQREVVAVVDAGARAFGRAAH
jgi:hypothetical protein